MPMAVIRTEADYLPQELAEFHADQARIQAKMLRKKDELETKKRQAEADATNEKAVWEDRDVMLAQIAADQTTILDLRQRTANLEEAIVEILSKEVAAPLIAAPASSRERRGRLSRLLKNFQQPEG